MRNINSLNSMLSRVRATQDLADVYERTIPGVAVASGNETVRDALDYCSGAAWFVINYLTGGGGVYGNVVNAVNQRSFTANTAAARLLKFGGHPGPYVGYLVCTQFAHECVFVRTGMQWAFYQANRTMAQENFTLAPSLNPRGRNWCLNDMSESQFRSFFIGLTSGATSARLFPYAVPPTQWTLAVYSFSGLNLLL